MFISLKFENRKDMEPAIRKDRMMINLWIVKLMQKGNTDALYEQLY
jgi:hypothetical protein